MHGSKGWSAFAACLLPVLLGFVVPVLFLLQQSFKRGLLANFDMTLWRDAFNSVAFATLATLIALAARLCHHSGLALAAGSRCGWSR